MSSNSKKVFSKYSIIIISVVVLILFAGEVAYMLGRIAGNC